MAYSLKFTNPSQLAPCFPISTYCFVVSLPGQPLPTPAVVTEVTDTLPMDEATVNESLTRASEESKVVEIPDTLPVDDQELFQDLAPNEDWINKQPASDSKVWVFGTSCCLYLRIVSQSILFLKNI